MTLRTSELLPIYDAVLSFCRRRYFLYYLSGHAHLGTFYSPHAGGVRPLCPYQILSGQLYSFKGYNGGPKILKLGHLAQGSPTYGSFYGPHVVWVRLSTKFEADCSICSKVIKAVPKFGN